MKQTANVDKIKRESFKAPIPGISLTETPGKFPWDKPPRMTAFPTANGERCAGAGCI